MKNSRRVLALLTVVLTLLATVACNKNGEAMTTEPVQETVIMPEETGEAQTQESTAGFVTGTYTEQNTTTPSETTTAQVVTENVTQTATDPAATTKPAPTAAATTKPAVTTTKPVAATKPVATTKPVTAPTSKADIVKLYNSAASTAASKKPGYSKTVDTSMSNVSMGALSKISAVKDVVGDFLGEGKSSSTVSKGSFNGTSLVKSTLKADDVSSAKCTLSADKKYYIVEITVKNETNPVKSKSALGRFTGDYKDVNEIKAGMNEAGAKADSITVNTSAVKITAKIEVATNRFVSVSHSFKMSATLTNVRYSIAKVKKATADLSTTVSYSDFRY